MKHWMAYCFSKKFRTILSIPLRMKPQRCGTCRRECLPHFQFLWGWNFSGWRYVPHSNTLSIPLRMKQMERDKGVQNNIKELSIPLRMKQSHECLVIPELVLLSIPLRMKRVSGPAVDERSATGFQFLWGWNPFCDQGHSPTIHLFQFLWGWNRITATIMTGGSIICLSIPLRMKLCIGEKRWVKKWINFQFLWGWNLIIPHTLNNNTPYIFQFLWGWNMKESSCTIG